MIAVCAARFKRWIVGKRRTIMHVMSVVPAGLPGHLLKAHLGRSITTSLACTNHSRARTHRHSSPQLLRGPLVSACTHFSPDTSSRVMRHQHIWLLAISNSALRALPARNGTMFLNIFPSTSRRMTKTRSERVDHPERTEFSAHRAGTRHWDDYMELTR